MIDRYFSKPQHLPPPKGVVQENLLWMRTLRKRTKLLRNKNKKKWRRKNKKRECRREIGAKKKELKLIKKAEKDSMDEKEM